MSNYNITVLFAKRVILKYVFGKTFERSQKFVSDEYETAWKKWETSRGGSGFFSSKPIPAFEGNSKVLRQSIDIQGSSIREIAKEIAKLKPRTVLELGSGVGINLFALAVLCPSVLKWQGIELTHSGVEIANRLQTNTPIEELKRITNKQEHAIRERLKNSNISFMEGSILSMPFPDNSFELVFSHEVFEQIPQEYRKGMSEAARVTKKYAIFVEAFREAQRNIFQRMHQKNVDYFRWSYRTIPALGFSVIKFTHLPLVKKSFSDGLLMCEKKTLA